MPSNPELTKKCSCVFANAEKQNVRWIGSHVEYESRRFYGAFGLSFSLAGVTDALVDKALRNPAPDAADADADAAGSAGRKGKEPVGGASAQAAAYVVSDGGGGGGGGGVGAWAEESRRVEAGEVLSRRALSALKVHIVVCFCGAR